MSEKRVEYLKSVSLIIKNRMMINSYLDYDESWKESGLEEKRVLLLFRFLYMMFSKLQYPISLMLLFYKVD